jgi:hypothetical protein
MTVLPIIPVSDGIVPEMIVVSVSDDSVLVGTSELVPTEDVDAGPLDKILVISDDTGTKIPPIEKSVGKLVSMADGPALFELVVLNVLEKPKSELAESASVTSIELVNSEAGGSERCEVAEEATETVDVTDSDAVDREGIGSKRVTVTTDIDRLDSVVEAVVVVLSTGYVLEIDMSLDDEAKLVGALLSE